MTKKTRHIALISGGKDSTALALFMRDKYPDLDIEYVFCDTHKELPETYEYLSRIEAYLGKSITRLSSDVGERGFDHHLKVFRGYLPSSQVRWCTKELKIRPFEKYVGEDPVKLYVGIRADEHREGYISSKPNIEAVFPFKDHGINKEDVFDILSDSGVGIPKYYEWRTRSGCYFCFFQRKIEWVGLYEMHPDLFEEAESYEKVDEGYTWQQSEALSQLIEPERIKAIKSGDKKRKLDAQKRRKAKTLMEVYSGQMETDDSQEGCLICHL